MAEWSSSAGSAPAFVGDDVVAVIGGEEHAHAAVARIENLPTIPSLSGLIDIILAGGSVASAPAFFVAVRSEEYWRCAIRGQMEVVIDGDERVIGTSVETWCELRVAAEAALEVRVLLVADDRWQPVSGGATRVSGLRRESPTARVPLINTSETLVGLPEPAERPPPLAPSRYDDLFGELTVARGVSAAAVADHSAEQEAPTTRDDATPEIATTDTAKGFDHSAVAVSAILCDQQHPNPPERARCWRCSAGLDSRAIVRVPRPSLGRLSLADGREIEIDRTILIGRNPRAERTDAAHLPTLVSIGSDAAGVSRTHTRIFLDGWQVLVEDLGSSFGTSLIAADGTIRRLRPGQPELVRGDSLLDLGGGSEVRIVGVP